MDQPSARIPGQCDDDTRRTLDARGRRRRHLRRVLEAARSLTGARTHVGFAKAPGEAQKAQECRERLGWPALPEDDNRRAAPPPPLVPAEFRKGAGTPLPDEQGRIGDSKSTGLSFDERKARLHQQMLCDLEQSRDRDRGRWNGPCGVDDLCPICGSAEEIVFQKERNVSCGDYFEGKRLYPENIGLVTLVRCEACEFARFREMHGWSEGKFQEEIYNKSYHLADAPFKEERPRALALWLGPLASGQRLLDYGGGNGRTAALLRQGGIEAASYDPFYGDEDLPGWKAEIVTAFEVIEHVPDQVELFRRMLEVVAPGGVLIFSTLFQPDRLAPDWWYASPRNGHVSFHTKNSLDRVLERFDLHSASLSQELHVASTDRDKVERLYNIDALKVSGEPGYRFDTFWDRLIKTRLEHRLPEYRSVPIGYRCGAGC